ncbi:MAG TPA: copper chaperone [Aquificaceae bacterium]|nr:copper chaperone [Aquificaceae bacterium]HIQ49084.1 copper chaperone [Aquifex aeolicus]
MKEIELKIEGMSCMHCVNTVKKALSEIDGVLEVEVSLEKRTARVKLDKEVPFETLREAVQQWGYKVVE